MKLLERAGIIKTIGDSCKCSSSVITYSYKLPLEIDISLVDFLSDFGASSTSIKKQALLKIENKDFSITGVRRLKQIKLVIKNNNSNHLVIKFEESLLKWLEKRNG